MKKKDIKSVDKLMGEKMKKLSLEEKEYNIRPGIDFIKGRLCQLLIPATFLLGTELGKWYEKNPYHKFNKGDILILKGNFAGYGVNPVFTVNGYIMIEEFGKKVGKYDISLFENELSNTNGNNSHIHFKWNIENQFKKVSVNSLEEARNLYL